MRITIVQQGVWHMARESMPLAAGYLAGCIRADPVLATGCEVSIANFSGTVTPLEMAVRLLEDGVPDLVGFSVLGWNLRRFSAGAAPCGGSNHITARSPGANSSPLTSSSRSMWRRSSRESALSGSSSASSPSSSQIFVSKSRHESKFVQNR